MSQTLTPHDGTGAIITVPGFGTVLACGITVPADGAAGYAVGCLFIHTDGGAGTALYCNEGTNASANFDAVSVA